MTERLDTQRKPSKRHVRTSNRMYQRGYETLPHIIWGDPLLDDDGGGGGGGSSVDETFDGTAGTTLIDAGWLVWLDPSFTFVLDGSGAAWCGTQPNGLNLHPAMLGVNQWVEVDYERVSTDGTSELYIYLNVGPTSSPGANCIGFQAGMRGAPPVDGLVAIAVSPVSSSAYTFDAGTIYTVRAESQDGAYRLLIDGVEALTDSGPPLTGEQFALVVANGTSGHANNTRLHGVRAGSL